MSITSKDIAKKNDLLRTTFMTGRIVLTLAVRESVDREEVITAVREFNDFNGNNDPHGEHDCGVVKVSGNNYIFKVDYYNSDYTMGVDPYDESEDVRRVLTIMRSDEY
jgi:hypothetical protein